MSRSNLIEVKDCDDYQLVINSDVESEDFDQTTRVEDVETLSSCSFQFKFPKIELSQFWNSIIVHILLILWELLIIYLDILVAPGASICSIISLNLSLWGMLLRKIANLESIWWLASFNGIVVSILGIGLKIYRISILHFMYKLIDNMGESFFGLDDDDFFWEMILAILEMSILAVAVCYHLIVIYLGHYHELLPFITIRSCDDLVTVAIWYNKDDDEYIEEGATLTV